MAILLMENRIIDWATCWTSNRSATQELLLEDVDGDGHPDVAFRASKGFFGLRDKRLHSRPGVDGKWLYAYAISDEGFRSLFPATERDVPVKISYDTAGLPVALEVQGLPKTLRERRMVECTIVATNTSSKELPIKPGEWFQIDSELGGNDVTYKNSDTRAVLKPGESISQIVHFLLNEAGDEANLRCQFKPASEKGR